VVTGCQHFAERQYLVIPADDSGGGHGRLVNVGGMTCGRIELGSWSGLNRDCAHGPVNAEGTEELPHGVSVWPVRAARLQIPNGTNTYRRQTGELVLGHASSQPVGPDELADGLVDNI
jgi:hypothetical protein